ncbi:MULTISPECIES: sigma-54-dependent Fis family transcriptional regulator [Gordonia]|uniref:Putative Fis family transcriptional regulator n=1 Tax=Gordonia sihwensis NBRC 108236 TaxID=1223544 RepID=L7LEW2_9ACTN|nr:MULTISPECIES: helix-turn-helix domain-containing protein [Gordonia]WFN93415.1 helix-turn-helix domain-containing protein [Gordonia sihwensis]GAC59281.1 putative Fis family transcriptional regulator [Gordonia sihwensis NBRC 108236]
MTTPLPQRDVIAASWRRVTQSGLSPDSPFRPAVRDIADDRLLDAARPVLARAASMLSGTTTALLLVDQDCRMVSRVSADSTLERHLESVGAVEGAACDESRMGTTALGTTVEVRGDVVINGSEHYLEQFRSLSCFGRPIVHPATRRVAGAICMTEVAPQINPLSVPLVRGLVDDIAERLLNRTHADHRAVIAAFEKTSSRRDVAVAAVGDDLQLTNALAAQLLGSADFGSLRAMLHDRSERRRTITLVSGIEADIEIDRVDGVRHAAVFRLRPRVGHRTPADPVPRAAAASVAICGEPGTGRTTEAQSLIPDDRRVRLDVAAALLDGTPPDVAAAIREARSAGHGLVVDGADLLDDRSIRLLQAAIAAHRPDLPPIVVVCEPVTGGAAGLAALVGCCRTRVTLPPLRQRTSEIVSLAQRMLERCDRRLELGPDAADALACQEWPGNLTEMSVVLGAAAETTLARGGRQLTAADLPEGYRGSSRASRLMGLEQAERQAIIDALDAADGNKSHAAKALGVSRTTLYARIRALGISR